MREVLGGKRSTVSLFLGSALFPVSLLLLLLLLLQIIRFDLPLGNSTHRFKQGIHRQTGNVTLNAFLLASSWKVGIVDSTVYI